MKRFETPPTLAGSARALRLLMLASLVVPAVMFASVAAFDRDRIIRHATEELERTVDVLHEHASSVLSAADLAIQQANFMAASLGPEGVPEARDLHAFLRLTTEKADGLSSIWFLDAEGRAVLGSSAFPLSPVDLRDRPYFRALRDGQADLAVSEVITGRLSGEHVFVVARPRRAPNGNFEGVVNASINAGHFVSVFRAAAPRLNFSAGLVRSDGIFILRDAEAAPTSDGPPRASRAFLEAVARADTGSFRSTSTIDGVQRLVAYRKVEGYPVYVLLAVGIDAVLVDWWTNVALYGALCLAAAVSLFMTAAAALRRAMAEQEALANWHAEVERRERAEGDLRAAQKMEAVGQLSGGIAHDFNNLLQALAGCLRLIERKAPTPEIRPLVDAGRQAVDRGAKLTQQLLAFARRQELRPEPVDVRDRILGMSELLARALRADIRVEVNLDPGLWPVEVDPTQFELAVLNLAVNARDAMPGTGRLTIRAFNATFGPAEDPDGLQGDHVCLSLSDTGSGMPPEVLARAFDPFFTTKGLGKGTGLGLSQVYGFARQSGGVARIESVPGHGSTVSMILPRCAGTPARAAAQDPAAPMAGAGRRILLVEDDPIVAAVTGTTVEDMGFAVTRAASADDALDLIRSGVPVDLLLTDVVMPGSANGLDLAREARRLRPGLPILVTTGYSEGVASGQGFRILPKPYGIEDLSRALAATFAESPERPSNRAIAS